MDNLHISVLFQNGVEKRYDVRNLYPVFPQFHRLEIEPTLFAQVQVDIGGYGISWDDTLDLDAEELWENGITVTTHTISAMESLAESLTQARVGAGMTQKQLAEITGIHQADISKIERGLANPSISTLQRLADGLQAELVVQIRRTI